MGKWPVGRWSSQNTHSTYQLSPLPYMGVVHSVLKQFTIVASMNMNGQTAGDDGGHGSLVCCSPCSHKELDTTEWLNNNNN